MTQIHKKFSSEQVKEILGKYEKGLLAREAVEELLEIKRSRFFYLLKT